MKPQWRRYVTPLYGAILVIAALTLAWQSAALVVAGYQVWGVGRIAKSLETAPNVSAEPPAASEAPKGAKAGGGKKDGSEKPNKDAPEGKREKLTQRAMFGKASEKKAKKSEPAFTGVLGAKAIVDGKLVAVGADLGGSKIVEILPANIVIEKEGATTVLTLFPDINATPKPQKARGGGGKRPKKTNRARGGQ